MVLLPTPIRARRAAHRSTARKTASKTPRKAAPRRMHSAPTLGDYGDDFEGLGRWRLHLPHIRIRDPFHTGLSWKKAGKAIAHVGHEAGKVITSKPFQLVEGAALAATGLGIPAAALVMGGTKAFGGLIKPGGNLKHGLTNFGQGAIEGGIAGGVGRLARMAASTIHRTAPGATVHNLPLPAQTVARPTLPPSVTTTDTGASVPDASAPDMSTDAPSDAGGSAPSAPSPLMRVASSTVQAAQAPASTTSAPSTDPGVLSILDKLSQAQGAAPSLTPTSDASDASGSAPYYGTAPDGTPPASDLPPADSSGNGGGLLGNKAVVYGGGALAAGALTLLLTRRRHGARRNSPHWAR